MFTISVQKNEYHLDKLSYELSLSNISIEFLSADNNTVYVHLSEQPSAEIENNIINIVNNHIGVCQKDIDLAKYMARASVKDRIIAEMASENMERVRNQIWTVNDLISLTQNEDLKLVLDDIHTLSFELAVGKLEQINNPLVTEEIKNGWIQKLQSHFYNT